MLLSLKRHISFISVLALWVLAASVFQPLAMILVLSTLALFFLKQRYYEALLGFFFILILSDSFEPIFSFAQVIKPFYLVLMSLLIFKIPGFIEKNYNFLIRFGPYLVIALICIVFSPVTFISLQKLLSYGLLLFAVPNLILYEYRRYGNDVLITIVSFSFLIYVLSFIIVLFLPETGISHGDRWRGIFGNPNGLGLYLTVNYILFRVVTDRSSTSFSKVDLWLYYFFAFMLLWMSGSRNSLLSIMIFEIIARGFKYSKPLTILLLVAVVTYFEYIISFILLFLTSAGLDSDLRLSSLDEGSGRLVAWQFAYTEIQKNTFILGKGLGYDEYFMGLNYNFLSRLGHQGGVHNTYLIIWLNTGIVGLIAFLIAFFSFFREAFAKNRFAFASMLAVLVSINHEPWLSASLNPYTSIFLIFMVVYLYVDKEEDLALNT